MLTFKNRKVRTIIILSAFILLFLTSVNVLVSYINTKKTVKMSISNNSVELAKTIAASINTENYQRFITTRDQSADYWQVRDYLYDAKKNTGALYIYTLLIDNPKVAHIMIAGFPVDYKKSYIGKVSALPKSQVRKAYYEGVPFYTDIIDDGTFGKYITAGAPIKDKKGKVIGYVGVDIGTNMLDEIIDKVIKSSISVFFFNVLFILIIILSIVMLQKWYQKELKNVVGETEEAYQQEMHSLFNSVKSLRHDFINHIQVIHGLLKLKNYEKTFEYVDLLSKEVKFVQLLPLKINNPALLVLFQTKWVSAQNKKVDVSFNVSEDSFQQVKTTDLIKILSNLIDNALDAVMSEKEENRKLQVICTEKNDEYIFEVANTGPVIDTNCRKHLFDSGFSTKQKDDGKPRGQGLYIVKGIVSEYGGEISVESTEKETRFRVSIPFQNGK